jgi:hypothetical protein
MSRLVVALLALSACSEANYVLELEPVVPGNQTDLIASALNVRIRVDDASGVSEVASLPLSGNTEAREAGVLARSWITASLEDIEGNVMGYGEVGPFDLARESGVITAPILMASTSGIGELDNISRESVHAGVAMTGSGVAYVFGGTTQAGEDGKNTIFRADLDSGNFTFENVGRMPEAVIGPRATVVDVEGQELVLVTGGQLNYDDFGPYTRAAFLIDPATDAIVWEGETEYHHAQHIALPLRNGRVMLASAGIDSADEVGDVAVEVFNPVTRRSRTVPNVQFGNWGFGAALLTSDLVLFCGGSELDSTSGTRSIPVTDCALVDQLGEISELGVPTLPQPLHMHAMTTLKDGRVLVTGGIPDPVSFSGFGDAIASAWLWDPNDPTRWEELPPMMQPRAKHAMHVLNDGTVMIVGGATTAGLLERGIVESPRCPELFDPDTLEFSVAELCHTSGTGTDVASSFHPRGGLLLLEGMQDNGEGGKRMGYVPARPR